MVNKYGAKKTEYRGVVYDSKWEAQKAYELDMLQRAGKITDLQRQVPFVLQERYVNNEGDSIRPIFYVADFYYYDVKMKMWVVMDTKGYATDVYKIKRKIFMFKYPKIKFIEAHKM